MDNLIKKEVCIKQEATDDDSEFETNADTHYLYLQPEEIKEEEFLETDNNKELAATDLPNHHLKRETEQGIEKIYIKSESLLVNNFEKQQKTSTKEKPCNCKSCKNAVSKKQCPKPYIEVSNVGKNKFVCKICRYSCSRKNYMMCHVRMHIEEKTFECAICAKKFSKKTNLKVHLRIHTREKPFECTICTRKFSLNGNLRVHMKQHVGETRADYVPVEENVLKK